METQILKPLPTALPPLANPNNPLFSAATISHLKQIHALLLRSGLDLNPSFLSKLLSLPLSSPSSLHYALSVLLHIPGLDARARNRAIRALDPRRALLAYACLRAAGIVPDRFTFPPLLRAAARDGGPAAEEVLREAHGLVVRMGFDSDPFVETALVRAYASRECHADAREVFDRMLHRDVVAWGVMLDGCCQNGRYDEALQLFEEMKSSTIVPDGVILATVLSACGRTRNLEFGRVVHSYIIDSNLAADPHLLSSLINMYASCRAMDAAQQLFDEISPKNLVASTAMVFGYARVGEIQKARSVFDRMDDRDLVSWSAMISGYAESDQPNEALKLFNQMQSSGVQPDQITMLSVISACAHLGALDLAKWVHVFVDNNGFGGILSISNALIDMYSKCGNLTSAQRIFDEMPQRNVITWSSMITAHAMHGHGRSALALFERMKAKGIKPNGVTFVGLLYACSHAGLVDEGRHVFQYMVKQQGIKPKHEHYGCMVDLLGRAQLLQEAFDFVQSMPFRPNVVEWGALLSACRVHGNVEIGEIAAKKLLELEPDHDGAYVLLSNIYAKASRWDDVGQVRRLMKSKGVLKERGYSWIELNGNVHEFAMGDDTHPNSGEIHQKLNEIVTNWSLKDMFQTQGVC